MTFAGRSYARWTLVDKHGFENRLSVSMKIKTRQKNANLMFASGTVDYSILEVRDIVIIVCRLIVGLFNAEIKLFFCMQLYDFK